MWLKNCASADCNVGLLVRRMCCSDFEVVSGTGFQLIWIRNCGNLPDGEKNDPNCLISSAFQASYDFQGSYGVAEIRRKEDDHNICEKCEAPSSLCAEEVVDTLPVDFENNGLLQLPPESEDEKNEREAILFDDNDDGYVIEVWGCLCTSGRFGSGEHRSRDRSCEEHTKDIKNIVRRHFENIPVDEKDVEESWLGIITSLSWEAAVLLKPERSRRLIVEKAKAECSSPTLPFLSVRLTARLRAFSIIKSNSMFLTRTEYDRGVNTFSPEGRLFQVEYAIEAIKLGSTAIGIKTREGVVLAVEKRITSPLLEPSSVEKIMEIDEHIGCAMSGLIADARTLVEHARVETQNHRFSYGEPMTVESTTQALCDLALRFGEGDEESMSRPFGVSLLIAGHDEHGPSLYYTDPSGTFWQCNAKAIGSGSEGADSSLQEQYNSDLSLQEAEKIALSILKQVMEEKVTPNNVDIAKVAPAYHLYTPSEVEVVISRL
ncbi:hypothetical protein Nepgr_016026 [Nepenthes gracilis]|uniref:Proteasome alpha-type subunits domain-containing protein n=1 Tax=Nepenthes gracilis TaxID=150966 RepID=A0AAD3SNX0_NEPGR|nr:hypothetical protein Nepgr_016026 [Nepenthes gracilis]